jgi:hypothetical protein
MPLADVLPVSTREAPPKPSPYGHGSGTPRPGRCGLDVAARARSTCAAAGVADDTTTATIDRVGAIGRAVLDHLLATGEYARVDG